MTVDDTIDSITVGWNWGIVGATVLYYSTDSTRVQLFSQKFYSKNHFLSVYSLIEKVLNSDSP